MYIIFMIFSHIELTESRQPCILDIVFPEFTPGVALYFTDCGPNWWNNVRHLLIVKWDLALRSTVKVVKGCENTVFLFR